MQDSNKYSSWKLGVHGLTMGIDVITGCTAAFLMPYMAEHPRIWE